MPVKQKPILSIITISDGNISDLLKTSENIDLTNQNEIEWVIVTKESSLNISAISPDVIVTNANRGIFDAFNCGLSACSGQYIIFMNSGDEFVSKDTPLELLEIVKIQKALWIVGKAYVGELYMDLWTWPRIKSWRFYFGTNSYCHQATIYNREVFNILGLFPIDYLVTDWALSLKLSKIVPPMLVNSFWTVYEGNGISTRIKLRRQIYEKCKLREYYQIRKYPFYLEIFFQALVSTLSLIKNRLQ